MSHYTLIIVLILSYLLGFGKALLDCKDPPVESESFFDLEELQSLAVTYPDIFQTPVECSEGTESSKCANQLCCGDDVGCCYTDPESTSEICGCKAKSDKICTQGPPLVYLHTYRCEDPSSLESYTCIRQNKEGESIEGAVLTSIGPVSRVDAVDFLVATEASISEMVPGEILNETGGTLVATLTLLHGLTMNEILNMVNADKLSILAQEVMARHVKGIPYGRQ